MPRQSTGSCSYSDRMSFSTESVALADGLLAQLRTNATAERAEHEKAYLRSDLVFLGATVPTIRTAARDLARGHSDLSHDEVMALVDELWGRGIHEGRMAAVELLRLYPARLSSADLGMLERLLRESRTWALVDALCTGVVAPIVETDPKAATVLDRWATDEDFWLRRSAVLSLLPALRRGEGDTQRLARFADAMLDEKEFFIRKAIGWVLRETGRKDPDFVVGWLAPRVPRASGVTLREAVKYLPAAERDRLIAAHRASKERATR